MKQRLLLCIDEANVYLRTLDEPFQYKINFEEIDEHCYDQELRKFM